MLGPVEPPCAIRGLKPSAMELHVALKMPHSDLVITLTNNIKELLNVLKCISNFKMLKTAGFL